MNQQEVKRVEEGTPNQRISEQEFNVAEKHGEVKQVRKHHQITRPISLISGAVLWSKSLSKTVESSSLGCYGLTQHRESVGFSGLHRAPIVLAVLDRRRPKLQLPGQ